MLSKHAHQASAVEDSSASAFYCLRLLYQLFKSVNPNLNSVFSCFFKLTFIKILYCHSLPCTFLLYSHLITIYFHIMKYILNLNANATKCIMNTTEKYKDLYTQISICSCFCCYNKKIQKLIHKKNLPWVVFSV